jgi:hypothetical protein
MTLNPSIAKILEPAYGPCPAFSGPCTEMRWDPPGGHVPRGFHGACGSLEEIELVLVFAEPGNPYPGENHTAIASTFRFLSCTQEIGPDQFHRNVKAILDSCWPQLTYEKQLRKVWMTESVLCSAPVEGGPVGRAASLECGRRYLLPHLNLLPHALVVALGRKAQDRLRALGYTKFLAASAVAPPGCNVAGAKESWARIPIELHRAR